MRKWILSGCLLMLLTLSACSAVDSIKNKYKNQAVDAGVEYLIAALAGGIGALARYIQMRLYKFITDPALRAIIDEKIIETEKIFRDEALPALRDHLLSIGHTWDVNKSPKENWPLIVSEGAAVKKELAKSKLFAEYKNDQGFLRILVWVLKLFGINPDQKIEDEIGRIIEARVPMASPHSLSTNPALSKPERPLGQLSPEGRQMLETLRRKHS